MFVLRRGLFGYRRSDVLAALEEQRRQIDALTAAVESLSREQGDRWLGYGERAAAARLDAISAKLDRLLAESDRPRPSVEADERHVYVSELGEIRARRIARRGGA